ncbi:MAP kinase kinase PBS2 [Elsinoe australis]|uniref:Carbonic anhydrase n=1 Tax=Elsinoe australis TaxID=40998 RepID=A0A2P7ZE27_9PEZI|nr:MAP kinase kinase PBS2 [Elsinoe australis]
MSQPTTPITDAIQAANAQWVKDFKHGDLPLPPGKKYTIVTCMDARLPPTDPRSLGVHPGDAHIIRNAGGSAVDALRSLLISQHLLGTEEILVIKHTGCGMLTFQDEDIKSLIAQRQGEKAGKDVEGTKFLPFGDLEAAVKEDVAFLKTNEALKERQKISGWIWEVETGALKRVV